MQVGTSIGDRSKSLRIDGRYAGTFIHTIAIAGIRKAGVHRAAIVQSARDRDGSIGLSVARPGGAQPRNGGRSRDRARGAASNRRLLVEEIAMPIRRLTGSRVM
jgi:hypothetical protein